MQTDLRYFFPVYLVFLPIDQNDELIVCRLFDQFSRHILDAVPSFEKMNINRSAGIADKVFILPQDAVQSGRRYFEEIIFANRILFIEDPAQFFTDSLAVFQVDAAFLSINTRKYQSRSRTYSTSTNSISDPAIIVSTSLAIKSSMCSRLIVFTSLSSKNFC